ncbi:PepSY domain-containing protein [Mucilaginibacter pedocola]|uniref:FAD-binding oxidoreductase n=1 Tax=Mucilaginibacter pedocola TaxID=1792845 RepID=A0A1S9P8K7_9SPHI|nr:PepSY domain-containing protein [Mucilaginibacter pedocola]OOQ57296.1 FAD-binding oxidoreductase [Mucilaginibacter pedocola]
MTISVWRYSHLALAVSSFLLLTLAAVTGIILAFQPVSEKLQPYRTDNFSGTTLAQTLPALRKTYPDITEISVDANHFVLAKGTDADGKKLNAYIDPISGKIVGTPGEKNEFFQWVTGLHRSLFLHEVGRFFVGLTAFLLLLITVSGTALIIQRQRGVKRFFTKIAQDNFAQYYHVTLGRLSLIPILIIALSGTYLSLSRFGLINVPKQVSPKIDFDSIKDKPVGKPADFAIFKDTKLSDVESVEFPFSEDAEDYYTLKLKTREVAVNQITGEILGETKYPMAVLLTNLSLDLHTGRASGIWAVVLAFAAANILFFIYSGFAITFKRLGNRSKNKYKAAESEYIILVGSENGSTFGFARAIYQSLIKADKRAHITELNNYTAFPEAKHIIVVTATYGLGDAPTNAAKFASLLNKHPQAHDVHYSVLGFGSHAYPDFCAFAYEANNLLAHQSWATPLIDIHTVNDRNPDEFALWAEAWGQQSGIQLSVLPQLQSAKPSKLVNFTVMANTATTQTDGTFTIQLKPKRGQRVTSGDLLAIYPANDHRERLYSIGVVAGQIRLSVRLQPNGLGSGFLHGLAVHDVIKAKVIDNGHFHFPAKAPQVIMISNGTGIAPFLGMLSQNDSKTPCALYCGFREQASYNMYRELLEGCAAGGKVNSINVSYSREGEKQYVSDLIGRDADAIADALKKGAVLMLCGSLAMQKDVMELLETISSEKTGKSISYYQSHGQVLSDCY